MSRSLADLEAGKLVPGDPDVVAYWDQLDLPPWFDEDRFQRGRRFFHDNILGILYSYMDALLLGFNIEFFLEILLWSGQSSTPERSGKRYYDTLKFLFRWFDAGIAAEGSVGRGSLMTVRKIHHRVRGRLRERDEKDREEGASVRRYLYLNQFDMAVVQTAFIVGPTLWPSHYGIGASSSERADFLYAWRLFGYFLGITDDFNVCGSDDIDVITKIVEEVKDEIVVPSVMKRNPMAYQLCEAFILGLHTESSLVNTAARRLKPAGAVSSALRPLRLGREFEPPGLTFHDIWTSWVMRLLFTLMYFFPWFRRHVNSHAGFPNAISLIME